MKKNILPLLTILIFLFSQQSFGQTWSPPKRLTWNAGFSSWPSIATDSGSGIHVVWSDGQYDDDEIFHKRSTDSGSTWSAPIRLTWNDYYSGNPSISIDSNGIIHVVWHDNTPMSWYPDIYHKCSPDGGDTWSRPSRISWNIGHSLFPSISTDSDDGIHVVWQDDAPGNDEIFYKHSTDMGKTWSRLKRLTWNSWESQKPSIAIDSFNVLHVVWWDRAMDNDILYKRSTDKGETWSGVIRLKSILGYSYAPSITTDLENRIHVVCYDGSPGNDEIYYMRSTDGGITWSILKRLTYNEGNSWKPKIAKDSFNGIHVVWIDDKPGNWEIYYKSSPDGGVTWSGPTRLTWNVDYSWNPSLAADSIGRIHVVWEDYTSKGYDIFYKNRK